MLHRAPLLIASLLLLLIGGNLSLMTAPSTPLNTTRALVVLAHHHRHPTPTPTLTPSPSPTSTPTPTPPPSGWVTVFDDEFSSVGVDSNKWSLYDGPYNSGQHNCATPSQDQQLGDGYLYLVLGYKSSGTCGAGWYTGGMMIHATYQYTDQAVTVRFRILPSANPAVVTSHHILPMAYPDASGDWGNAEEDYCESSDLGDCWTFLHYNNGQDQIAHEYMVNLTQWHTWRFEQQSGTLMAYLDGALVFSFTGCTGILPSVLRRVVLQQECEASGCPPVSDAGMTETLQIDYVTVQIPD